MALRLDLYACRKSQTIFTLVAEKDGQVIDLGRAHVYMVSGADIKSTAERHGKSRVAGVRTREIVVVKLRLVTRHAEERVRIRKERRRVAPVVARTEQQRISRNACAEPLSAECVYEVSIRKRRCKIGDQPNMRCYVCDQLSGNAVVRNTVRN